jgi:uncharacterized membrane protein YqaE (UPF0057 family)
MAQSYGTTDPVPATQPNVVYAPASSNRAQVSSSYDVLLYFVAIFVPPVPVLLKRGPGADFCINILLWIFGWIPGVIHSWYIISKSSGTM